MPVDYLDLNTRLADSITQLRCQVPLNFFTAELSYAGEQWLDFQLCSVSRKQRAFLNESIARVTFLHAHLIGFSVSPRRNQRERLAYRPETEQTNPVLPLNSFNTLGLQPAFNGITDVRGYEPEVRYTVLISGDALTVVCNKQVMFALFSTAGNRDVLGMRIDTVFDEFSDRFQRVSLRQRNNRNGMPIVPDAELAGLALLFPLFG